MRWLPIALLLIATLSGAEEKHRIPFVLEAKRLSKERVLPFAPSGPFKGGSLILFDSSSKPLKGDRPLSLNGGFTVEATIRPESLESDAILLSTIKDKRGLSLELTEEGKLRGRVYLRKGDKGSATSFGVEGGEIETDHWARIAFRGLARKDHFRLHLLVNGQVVAVGKCFGCRRIEGSGQSPSVGASADGSNRYQGLMHSLSVKAYAENLVGQLALPMAPDQGTLDAALLERFELPEEAKGHRFPVPMWGEEWIPAEVKKFGSEIWIRYLSQVEATDQVLLAVLTPRGELKRVLQLNDVGKYASQVTTFDLSEERIRLYSDHASIEFERKAGDPIYRFVHSGWLEAKTSEDLPKRTLYPGWRYWRLFPHAGGRATYRGGEPIQDIHSTHQNQKALWSLKGRTITGQVNGSSNLQFELPALPQKVRRFRVAAAYREEYSFLVQGEDQLFLMRFFGDWNRGLFSRVLSEQVIRSNGSIQSFDWDKERLWILQFRTAGKKLASLPIVYAVPMGGDGNTKAQ